MKFKIQIKFLNDVSFKNRNTILHKFFKTYIIKDINNKKQIPLSFFIEKQKIYYKNKNYILYCNSTIDNLDFYKKNNYLTVIKVEEKIDNISEYLYINNINYEFHKKSNILKNWNINIENINSKNIYWNPEMGKELLQELIEYQIYNNSSLKNKILPNKKTKHNQPYYSFIEKIVLNPQQKGIHIKDNIHIQSYDILLQIKENKASKLLAREMTYKGIGTKNSFGFGFVDYYDVFKGKLC